jgi:hypothetical protein
MTSPTRSRLPRWLPRRLRRFALQVERFRLAARMRALAGLIDVPHEVAAVAHARIARMQRRAAAVARIIG